MHIIFLNKNKQYTVDEKKIVKVDLIESNIGEKIKISDILYFKNETSIEVGNPIIKNKELIFEVIKNIKEKKNTILKFRRRKNYLKKTGHRQKYTLIKLISINNKEV